MRAVEVPSLDQRYTTVFLVVAMVASIFVHSALLIGIYLLPKRDWTRHLSRAESIDVSLVSPRALDAVETFQETAKQKPKDARYASDRDLSTDQETSPDQSRSNILKRGGLQGQANDRPGGARTRETFGLSPDEKMRIEDPFQNPAGGRVNRDLPSPGFVARLRRGEQLKVNALGLDYGQYIIRMRNKLASRWNWQRAVNPRMQEYQEVSVTLAVVLNHEGELSELKVLSGSGFSEFDQVAIDAFRQSAPFPNPPDSLIQDDGRVYVPWSFILNFRSWGNSRVE